MRNLMLDSTQRKNSMNRRINFPGLLGLDIDISDRSFVTHLCQFHP